MSVTATAKRRRKQAAGVKSRGQKRSRRMLKPHLVSLRMSSRAAPVKMKKKGKR